MKETIKTFTGLKVWQEGHQLVLMTYEATKSFPKDERFSLTDQMRRSAVSITSNIAEGFGRIGYKDKQRFYYHAHGSLTELKNQLLITKDIHYLTKTDFEKLAEQANTTHKLLRGLITNTQSFIDSTENS